MIVDMSNDDVARNILDTISYVVLATADEDGTPWSSPVWFAHETYSKLYSTVAPGAGQAVYMTATAHQLEDAAAVDHGLDVFSRASKRSGGTESGPERISGDARLRLYCATVIEHWILDPKTPLDLRVGVEPSTRSSE